MLLQKKYILKINIRGIDSMIDKNKITVEQFVYALSIILGSIVFTIGLIEMIVSVLKQIQTGSIIQSQLSLWAASSVIGMALVNLSIAVKALVSSRKLDLIEETEGNENDDR